MGGRHSTGSTVAGAWRAWRAEKEPWPPDSRKHLLWQVPLVVVSVLVIWYAVGLSLIALFWLIGLLLGY